HDGCEADHGHAALLHEQQGQAVFQSQLLVRRKLQRLRLTRESEERDQAKGSQKTQRAAHCLALPSAPASGPCSGTSVATVRLLALKYFRATRCTSSFVTAR